MPFKPLKTVALAALLCGSGLAADAYHGNKKENASQRSESRQNINTERSQRSESVQKRQASRPEKTEPRYRSVKETKPAKPAVKTTPKALNRPHRWVPPAAKPLPYYYRPGYTIRTIPSVAVTVTLGSLAFFYADGIYYSRHNSGYVVVLPPIGLIVPILPLGYSVFQVRGLTYYYYADVYYVWDVHHSAYRVVDAPDTDEIYQPGDIIDALPDGAYTVTIDGVQYYRYGGVYFLQSIQGKRVVYIVVTP